MRVRRSDVGVGVLDGVIYAVGGSDGIRVHRSVEAYVPSTGNWTAIADMCLCRKNAGYYSFNMFINYFKLNKYYII